MRATQGTLVSRNFINLLLKHALPATAQLVVVDSVSGEIIYPYDVSNYIGNMDLGYINLDGIAYYGGQFKYTPVANYSVTQKFDDYQTAFDGDVRYYCTVDQTLIENLQQNSSTPIRLARSFDPSDPSQGWTMEIIQIDASNDPSGPPIIFNITPLYQIGGAAKWWFGDFHFDEMTGNIDFTLKKKTIVPFPVYAEYVPPVGSPIVYFRFTWNFAILDRVSSIATAANRAEIFTRNLPRL